MKGRLFTSIFVTCLAVFSLVVCTYAWFKEDSINHSKRIYIEYAGDDQLLINKYNVNMDVVFISGDKEISIKNNPNQELSSLVPGSPQLFDIRMTNTDDVVHKINVTIIVEGVSVNSESIMNYIDFNMAATRGYEFTSAEPVFIHTIGSESTRELESDKDARVAEKIDENKYRITVAKNIDLPTTSGSDYNCLKCYLLLNKDCTNDFMNKSISVVKVRMEILE